MSAVHCASRVILLFPSRRGLPKVPGRFAAYPILSLTAPFPSAFTGTLDRFCLFSAVGGS
jgi:hypothetical protein